MVHDSMCWLGRSHGTCSHHFPLLILLLASAILTASQSAPSPEDAGIFHNEVNFSSDLRNYRPRFVRILQDLTNTTQNDVPLNETAADIDNEVALNETLTDLGANASDTGNSTNLTDAPSLAPNEPPPLETYGPFEVKYIYMVFYGIDEIPDTDEWAAVTEQYLTTLFEEDGRGRVENPDISIEFVRQLSTGGETEVLYIQTISYDSRSNDMLIDEFVMGPFYLDENRRKYVQMLKVSDSSGYAGLTDTSIAENLGDLDLSPMTNNSTTVNKEVVEEPTNNTMLYVGSGVAGAVLLIGCCCCCLCFTGVLGWNLMSSGAKTGEVGDIDELDSDDDDVY
ncbi:hypothetical protein HJC23_002607 [Cyclotella cryptica]|uniref:Uncharacterized protein n=1 Tax=Cyclotella cryptica TaxID=29204 RepID=A0ABD3PXR4_9STRA